MTRADASICFLPGSSSSVHSTLLDLSLDRCFELPLNGRLFRGWNVRLSFVVLTLLLPLFFVLTLSHTLFSQLRVRRRSHVGHPRHGRLTSDVCRVRFDPWMVYSHQQEVARRLDPLCRYFVRLSCPPSFLNASSALTFCLLLFKASVPLDPTAPLVRWANFGPLSHFTATPGLTVMLLFGQTKRQTRFFPLPFLSRGKF